MNGYDATPLMTHHARQRCQEMGISTKVAKSVIRNMDMTYAGSPKHDNDARLAFSSKHPEVVAVYVVHDNMTVILTVLPRTSEGYLRPEHRRA